MDRKLASIKRITKIEPIEGADKIEMVVIDGWQVVSQKGNFKAGDPCVYFEIDSVFKTNSPVGFATSSSLVTFNSIVTSLLFKSLEISCF